jgi:hypothetical protein
MTDQPVPRRPPAADRGTTRAARPARAVDDLILSSKITVPGVPDWAVQRPRITRLIAEGRRWCPLTVVTGSPGAGKTMALALWAATEPGPVAWLGLDDYDNRPEVFWPYVVAALHRAGLAVPKRLSAAGRGWADDQGLLLRFAALLAAQDPAVTLVLDDLHLLTEPQVLKGLDFVLRNAGAGLRLAVSSRMDPLLPLHRYRVAGQLAEIRTSDLASSAGEASLLLAQHGCTLTADLDQQLSLAQSRACAAMGDSQAALVTAQRAARDDSLEASVTLAHAWAAAGDTESARRALAPALAVGRAAPGRVRLHAAWSMPGSATPAATGRGPTGR